MSKGDALDRLKTELDAAKERNREMGVLKCVLKPLRQRVTAHAVSASTTSLESVPRWRGEREAADTVTVIFS